MSMYTMSAVLIASLVAGAAGVSSTAVTNPEGAPTIATTEAPSSARERRNAYAERTKKAKRAERAKRKRAASESRGKGKGLCATLECTPEQRQAIKEIRKDMRAEFKADAEELRSIRQAIAAEFAKDRPDEAKMKSLHRRMNTLKAEKSDHIHTAMMKVHAELTPEQRAKFAERIGKRGPQKALKGHGRGKHRKGEKNKVARRGFKKYDKLKAKQRTARNNRLRAAG